MTPDEFRKDLEQAVNGNMCGLEAVLRLYMPMIDRYSRVNGVLDEDLRQYIMLKIVMTISKFEI